MPKRSIVSAARRRLDDHGITVVSLRAIARDMGLSYSAPAKHFATRSDLLYGLAADGFDELGAALSETSSRRDKLEAIGRRMYSSPCATRTSTA